MYSKGPVASLTAAVIAIPLAVAIFGPATAHALAGAVPGKAQVSARARISPRAALAAGLTISGPVTLQYAATTSENDSCTGTCSEGGIGQGGYTSYNRAASGTLQSTVNFSVENGTTKPAAGQLSEPTDTYNASGSFTYLDAQCSIMTGSGTEVAQGGTRSGSLKVESLKVIKNGTGQTGLELLYDDFYFNAAPMENTFVTLNVTSGCQPAPFKYAESQSASDVETVNEALGLVTYTGTSACRLNGCYDITGWTINPNWTPQTGGTLATKSLTASAPQPGPDTGTVDAKQTWTLTTTPTLTITSPPADKTLALTDAKYFTPQPGLTDRQPEQRNLTVEGTAPQTDTSVTLNGVQVPVAGGTWKAELPITMAQLGQLTLTASGGTTTVQQTNTLIDIEITSPTENQPEPITAAPAMPPLNATLSVPGYPGATSGVSFGWTLDVRGETVSPPGTWTGYSQITTGSTTGTGEAWQPTYDHVVGGVARLTATADLPGVLDNPVTSELRWFTIPGTNPSAAVAKAYVDQTNPQYANIIRHLVCIESSWHQFNTAGYFPGNNNQPPIPDLPADWSPNPGLGQPLYGPPAGIGIAQLDQPPAHLISPDEYWNWQANLQGGYGVWAAKLQEAQGWVQSEQTRLDDRLKAALKRADANRAAQKPPLPPIDMNPVTVPPLTSQELIYQAIRYYNGQKEYHFDADYVLSANGLEVNLVPQIQQWVGGTNQALYGAPPSPDGNWGTVPHNLHLRQPWVAFPRNQNYVDQVLNCKNS